MPAAAHAEYVIGTVVSNPTLLSAARGGANRVPQPLRCIDKPSDGKSATGDAGGVDRFVQGAGTPSSSSDDRRRDDLAADPCHQARAEPTEQATPPASFEDPAWDASPVRRER